MRTHIVILAFLLQHLLAQNFEGASYFEKVVNALHVYLQHSSEEKVYLSGYDETYTTKDNIRFTAFVTYKNAPSPLSRILYVELINDTGKIITRLMLPVTSGMAYGNFNLKGMVPEGDYYIKAYTLWMLNFKADLPCLKRIVVADKMEPAKNTAVRDFNLQFYPEGGSLVTGLTSVVAFKAIDNNGNPVNVQGVLKDTSGKVFANINTVHDGMGSFRLHIPLAGNMYKAEVAASNGTHKIFALPGAKKSGIVIHVENDFDNNGNHIFYRISRSKADKELYQHLFLCVRANGQFTFDEVDFDSVHAGNDYDTIIYTPSPLLLNTGASGVVHLTVFNSLDGEILAERLLYNNDPKKITNPIIEAGTAKAGSESNIAVNLQKDFTGVYAVSVMDATQQEMPRSSLAADMLLNEQVTDTVYNPAWYFAGMQKEQQQQALDILLLASHTNFNWQRVFSRDTPVIKYAVEQDFILKGHAYEIKNNNRIPLRKGPVTLIIEAVNDSARDVYTVPVDSTGSFAMPDLDYHGNLLIYAQNTQKRKAIEVVFDNNGLDSITGAIVPQPKQNTIAATKFTRDTSPAFSGNNTPDTSHMTLKGVTVNGKTKSRLDSIVDVFVSPFFLGGIGKTYNLLDEPGSNKYAQNIIQWIQENIQGIAVETNTDGSVGKKVGSPSMPNIYWRLNYGAQSKGANRPQFFLNEAHLDYTTAIDLLTNLKVSDAALIKVYAPGSFVLGGNPQSGAILVYTKNGKDYLFNNNAGTHLSKTIKTGYSLQEPLPLPGNGDSLHQNNKHILYWNPALNTDSTGHIFNFSFYNNDAAPKRIRVEGIDKNGNLVEADKIIP